MLDDVFILDAVSHAYSFSSGNRIGQPYADGIAAGVFGIHQAFAPPGRPDLILDQDTFDNRICDAGVTGEALFAESHTDATIYHELPMYGYFRDGGSPLEIGERMRERCPERVYLYGGISPHQPDALERLEMLVAEHRITGIKIYPHDLIAGELIGVRMDDDKKLFPIFERARQLGLKNIAVHKAIVMGPVPLEPYSPIEVGAAARAFPDLTFEVVHGGFAYMEETLALMAWHPNIYVSLEGTSALLAKAPRRFLEIIGQLMANGGTERILWAIGGLVVHSRWYEETFWQIDMPDEFVEGYGYPPLTDDAKRAILGLNAARMLGIDVEDFRRRTGDDGYAKPRTLKPAYSALARG